MIFPYNRVKMCTKLKYFYFLSSCIIYLFYFLPSYGRKPLGFPHHWGAIVPARKETSQRSFSKEKQVSPRTQKPKAEEIEQMEQDCHAT